MQLEKVNKLLIVRLSSLGDILLSTPLIRSIKIRFSKTYHRFRNKLIFSNADCGVISFIHLKCFLGQLSLPVCVQGLQDKEMFSKIKFLELYGVKPNSLTVEPKINNSHEAKELLKRGGGLMVRGKREAYRRMRSLFSDKELREARGKISMEYVQKSTGATDKIIGEIEEVI